MTYVHSSCIFVVCLLTLGNFVFGRTFSFSASDFKTDICTVSGATLFTFISFLIVHSTMWSILRKTTIKRPTDPRVQRFSKGDSDSEGVSYYVV